MISKISFSKLVRDEMRKLNWLLAVQILVFGLLIPFRVLMELAMRRPQFFAGQTHIRDTVQCDDRRYFRSWIFR